MEVGDQVQHSSLSGCNCWYTPWETTCLKHGVVVYHRWCLSNAWFDLLGSFGCFPDVLPSGLRILRSRVLRICLVSRPLRVTRSTALGVTRALRRFLSTSIGLF